MGKTATAIELAFTCEARELAEVVGRAATLAQRGGKEKNILHNVRIEAKAFATSLEVSATDATTWMVQQAFRVEIKEPGAICLPAARLAKILGRIEERCEVEVRGFVTTIKSAGQKFTIYGEDAGEFPEAPSWPAQTFKLPAAELRAMLGKVSFAASLVKERYAFSAVALERGGDQLTAVATDGKRLAFVERRIASELLQPVLGGADRALLPLSLVHALVTHIAEDAEELELALDDRRFYARAGAGAVDLSGALVEGHFPPWRQVLEQATKHNPTPVILDRLAVAAAVQDALLLSDLEGALFVFEREGISLKARGRAIGDACSVVPCAWRGAAGLAIGLNGRFVVDALRAMTSDQVELKAKDPKGYATIWTELPAGPGQLTHALMPMQLSEESAGVEED